MKKINTLNKDYQVVIDKIDGQKLKEHELLKAKIKATKKHLQKLRVYVRNTVFESIGDEILFFKIIKPKICGELKFYKKQLDYHSEKPFVTINYQKDFIDHEIKRLEKYKKQNTQFFKYLKQENTIYDDKYFLRDKEQLSLFDSYSFVDIDPEFSTSHDLLACEVVTYDLLTQFYKQELHCLLNLEHGFNNTIDKKPIQEILNWTASKTDLVELIYALKVSGVINNGDVSIKQLIDFFNESVNIDLTNYYKTYNEIRNRTQNQTKFLSKLSLNLEHKLEMDEE